MFVRKPTVIKLDSLKTLAEAYTAGALRSSPKEAIYEPNRTLLERVSLLCVLLLLLSRSCTFICPLAKEISQSFRSIPL